MSTKTGNGEIWKPGNIVAEQIQGSRHKIEVLVVPGGLAEEDNEI